MKRDIALLLMRVAGQHQQREYNAWHGATSDKEAEKHRLACADWATAGQQLYDLIERNEYEVSGNDGKATGAQVGALGSTIRVSEIGITGNAGETDAGEQGRP